MKSEKKAITKLETCEIPYLMTIVDDNGVCPCPAAANIWGVDDSVKEPSHPNTGMQVIHLYIYPPQLKSLSYVHLLAIFKSRSILSGYLVVNKTFTFMHRHLSQSLVN